MSYALLGRSGLVEANDYRGRGVIAAYSPIGILGLGGVLKIDKDELYLPISSRLIYLLFILLALVSCGMILLRLQMSPLVKKILREISVRKKAEADLYSEKERAEVTLQSIADGVITTDALERVVFINPVAEKLTGWRLLEAKGRVLDEIFNIRDNPAQHAVSGQQNQIYKHMLISKDGSELPVQSSRATINDRGGNISGKVLVFRDVTEARELADKLSWQASHDALTGLSNRIAFEHRLNELLHDPDRREDVLLYLDLDQFKVVNDTCGHLAGDQLLVQISMLLTSEIRKGDVLARLGGDEFGILLKDCNVESGLKIAQSMLRTVSDYRYIWQDKVFGVGVSIGLVPITPKSDSAAHLLSSADSACYAAKDKGRNRVHVSSEGSEDHQRHDQMQWVPRIRKALEENRFKLYRQEIVSMAAEKSEKHYELLIRMEDEYGVIVPPMAFIPSAERYNLIALVDRWVVAAAFGWLAANSHDATGRSHRLSINLSGQSLCDEHFSGYVLDQFDQTKINPSCICFEITETAAIANLLHAKEFISVLKARGCRFSLDDFGSGMSSYSYLKNLDVDYLKIDGMFVKDMVHDPVDLAMVESINRIGHVMGIRTIAESVENDEILSKIREIDVDYAQGYALHRPEPML